MKLSQRFELVKSAAAEKYICDGVHFSDLTALGDKGTLTWLL